MTQEKFDKLYDVVRTFLETDPDLRIDDEKLAARVESYYNPRILDLSYMEVKNNRYKYITYSAESISRIRRRVQEEVPQLRPTQEQIDARVVEEAEYKKFVRRRNMRRRNSTDGEE